jgi:septal ring factor EnvC (AmiA/AmiB activator)
MCFGGGAQAPSVEYRGPSDDDIRRNESSLAQYQQQMTTQQDAFQSQLQEQIANANAETEALKSGYAAEASAAAAASAAEAATYTTTAEETGMPEGAQTTSAVTDKKKPKKNLKISTGGTMASAGSGLNIGV